MNQRTYTGRAAIPAPRSSEDTITLPTPDPLAPVALAAYRLGDPDVPDHLAEQFAASVEAFLRGLVGPARCTEPATVRYEVYSPRNGMAHGSLDASVNYCAEHAPGAVAALHRDGFTAYRANNRPSGGQVCGDRFDFTKGVGTAVASSPVAPTQGVGQRPVPDPVDRVACPAWCTVDHSDYICPDGSVLHEAPTITVNGVRDGDLVDRWWRAEVAIESFVSSDRTADEPPGVALRLAPVQRPEVDASDYASVDTLPAATVRHLAARLVAGVECGEHVKLSPQVAIELGETLARGGRLAGGIPAGPKPDWIGYSTGLVDGGTSVVELVTGVLDDQELTTGGKLARMRELVRPEPRPATGLTPDGSAACRPWCSWAPGRCDGECIGETTIVAATAAPEEAVIEHGIRYPLVEVFATTEAGGKHSVGLSVAGPVRPDCKRKAWAYLTPGEARRTAGALLADADRAEGIVR